jgi:hypothetical protein
MWTESIPISNLGRETPNLLTEAYVKGSMINFAENTAARAPYLGGKIYTINQVNGSPDIKQMMTPEGKVVVEIGMLELPREQIANVGLYSAYL